MGCELFPEFLVHGVPVEDIDSTPEAATDKDGEEREASLSSIEVVPNAEHDGERFEKQIDAAVHELHKETKC